MQFQSEETPEQRYDAETVRRATALAARLQEQQSETLSRDEAGSLGEELGIDPRHMFRALDIVSREGQQQQYRQTVPSLPRPRIWKSLIIGAIAAMIGLWLMRSSVAVASPELTPPVPIMAEPPAVATPAPIVTDQPVTPSSR